MPACNEPRSAAKLPSRCGLCGPSTPLTTSVVTGAPSVWRSWTNRSMEVFWAP